MSLTVAVLVTSIDGDPVMVVTVGSLAAAVVGSSLVSETLLLSPGLLAIAVATFETFPLSAACCSMM